MNPVSFRSVFQTSLVVVYQAGLLQTCIFPPVWSQHHEQSVSAALCFLSAPFSLTSGWICGVNSFRRRKNSRNLTVLKQTYCNFLLMNSLERLYRMRFSNERKQNFHITQETAVHCRTCGGMWFLPAREKLFIEVFRNEEKQIYHLQ